MIFAVSRKSIFKSGGGKLQICGGRTLTGNNAIASQVVRRAPLQKHIRLVNQQHRLPRHGQLQHPLQVPLHRLHVGAQLARHHDVQRPPRHLGDALHRERLADARRAVEEEHAALALALDQVVEAAVRVRVRILVPRRVLPRQRAQDPLLARRQHQQVKRVRVPRHVGDMVDPEPAPALLDQREARHLVVAAEVVVLRHGVGVDAHLAVEGDALAGPVLDVGQVVNHDTAANLHEQSVHTESISH